MRHVHNNVMLAISLGHNLQMIPNLEHSKAIVEAISFQNEFCSFLIHPSRPRLPGQAVPSSVELLASDGSPCTMHYSSMSTPKKKSLHSPCTILDFAYVCDVRLSARESVIFRSRRPLVSPRHFCWFLWCHRFVAKWFYFMNSEVFLSFLEPKFRAGSIFEV